MAETKLAQFLAAKKVNKARLLAASHKLETLQRADRAAKLAKRQAKKAEGGEKKEIAKPRSGRAVTPRALEAALSGAKPISGPTKQRILRAVNHLLEQKKAEKVDLKTLF
jgi:hypothetical protein